MKRGIYALLAMLTVFAMVSCGGGGGSSGGGKKGTTTVVTFDLNIPVDEDGNPAFAAEDKGGVPESVTVTHGEPIGTVPTITNTIAAGEWIFLGWKEVKEDPDGENDFITSSSTFGTLAKITLYAQWEIYTPVTVTFNIATNGGWNASNTQDNVTRTTHKGLALGAANIPANPFKPNNTFAGWYTSASGTGTTFDGTTPVTADLTVYARFTEDETVETVVTTAIEEWVVLNNAFYVVYKFELPSGKTWGDYDGTISVDYNVPTKSAANNDPSDWFTASNGARGMRMMGNYKSTDFSLITTTEATPRNLAIASYNDGKNNQYIIDAKSKVSWESVQQAVGPDIPASGDVAANENLNITPTPTVDSWFTVEYDATGDSKFTGNPGFDVANVPHPKSPGPFFFGVGIAAQNDFGTLQQIRNVTLKAKSGGTDVKATPAIFKKDGKEYPAFTGYPDTAGGNGVKDAYRGETRKVFAAGEVPTDPATEDLQVVKSTAPLINDVAFAGAYNSPNGIFVEFDFPANTNISSYASMTVKVEYTTESTVTVGTVWTTDIVNGKVQFDWVDATKTQIGGSVYNAGTSSTIKMDIPQSIKNVASTVAGIVVYNADAAIKFVKVTEVTLVAPSTLGTLEFKISDAAIKDPLSTSIKDWSLNSSDITLSVDSTAYATFQWKVINGGSETSITNELKLLAKDYVEKIGQKITISLVVTNAAKQSYSQVIILTVKE